MEIDRRELENRSPEEEQYIWLRLVTTPEGRILVAGLMLALLGILWLALNCLWEPEKSQALVAMTATNIIFGRAAGMTVGYTMGLDHIIVVPVNMLIETILVLLVYPLFVFSSKRLLVIRKLKNFIDLTTKTAEAQHINIRRYGMLGLFIFVWVPFWMTGPVVGCAIGFLMGLRPLFNLSVVLAGTYLAIICWGIFLRGISERIAAYSTFAPIILVAVVILIVLVSRMLHNMHREDNHRII